MSNQRSSASTAAILILLFLIAVGGIVGCVCFGISIHASHNLIDNRPDAMYSQTITSDSGLNGGAIGCGIFGAAALFGFVKLYIAKTN